MSDIKIFIGSSTESKQVAKMLREVINEVEGFAALGWWREDVLTYGPTYIESLNTVANSVDAAIMVFAEDDDLTYREEVVEATRDNVLFEYGLFMGELGREQVIAAVAGNPHTPSDLLGVKQIAVELADTDVELKERNENKIKAWLEQVKTTAPTSRDDGAERIQTQKEVLAYVFNHLNPYSDFSLSLEFLAGLPANSELKEIKDLISPLRVLIQHYVKEFVEDDMRVYFASELVAKKDDDKNKLYRISISQTTSSKEWREGFQFGAPSNVHRVFLLNDKCLVEEANDGIDNETEQNFSVDDEGSVTAWPVSFYDDKSGTQKCVGVVGLSSPELKKATQPRYVKLLGEVSVLFSSLFYSYGRYLRDSVLEDEDDIVQRIKEDLDSYFNTYLDQ